MMNVMLALKFNKLWVVVKRRGSLAHNFVKNDSFAEILSQNENLYLS